MSDRVFFGTLLVCLAGSIALCAYTVVRYATSRDAAYATACSKLGGVAIDVHTKNICIRRDVVLEVKP